MKTLYARFPNGKGLVTDFFLTFVIVAAMNRDNRLFLTTNENVKVGKRKLSKIM